MQVVVVGCGYYVGASRPLELADDLHLIPLRVAPRPDRPADADRVVLGDAAAGAAGRSGDCASGAGLSNVPGVRPARSADHRVRAGGGVVFDDHRAARAADDAHQHTHPQPPTTAEPPGRPLHSAPPAAGSVQEVRAAAVGNHEWRRQHVALVRVPRTLPRILAPEQVRALLDALRTDRDRAMAQWEGLRAALVSAGAVVEVLPAAPGVPDIVFTANAGIVNGRQYIPAKFKHEERQPEVAFDVEWFSANGFSVDWLPDGVSHEGAGDALPFGSVLRQPLYASATAMMREIRGIASLVSPSG